MVRLSPMRVANLVMGDDAKCVSCSSPDGSVKSFGKIPWDLCPVHFGDLADDPELRDLVVNGVHFATQGGGA